jgi:hypothetical protein
LKFPFFGLKCWNDNEELLWRDRWMLFAECARKEWFWKWSNPPIYVKRLPSPMTGARSSWCEWEKLAAALSPENLNYLSERMSSTFCLGWVEGATTKPWERKFWRINFHYCNVNVV